MGRRGPGALPQVEKREQYARLIGQGFSSLEACRIVGINPRTGKRWRHGRTITARDGRKLHYDPVITRGLWSGGRSRTGTCQRRNGCRSPTCARRAPGCGRSRSRRAAARPRSARELRRNQDPDSGQYRPFTAHKLAMQRRARPRPGKITADPVLRQFVAGRLEKRWSPQQVSRALPGQFPGERACHAVHETICQALYRPELGGLPRELPARVLRTGRRRRYRIIQIQAGPHTITAADPCPPTSAQPSTKFTANQLRTKLSQVRPVRFATPAVEALDSLCAQEEHAGNQGSTSSIAGSLASYWRHWPSYEASATAVEVMFKAGPFQDNSR